MSRYGGRLYTLPYGDAYLEMGANWIHGGSEENDLFDVAARRSLLDVQSLLLEDRAEGLFYTSQGQSIDSQLGVKCYQMFFDAELEAGRLYRSDARMKQRLASKSLLQFLEDEWIRLADEAFGPDGPDRPNADAIFQSMLLYFRKYLIFNIKTEIINANCTQQVRMWAMTCLWCLPFCTELSRIWPEKMSKCPTECGL